MSPVTHFFTGWVFAKALRRRYPRNSKNFAG